MELAREMVPAKLDEEQRTPRGHQANFSKDSLRHHVSWAVERGDASSLFEFLVSLGELDKTRSQSIVNPGLRVASVRGHAECVHLLLGFGANVDNTDEFGNTSLLLASEKGHSEVVELLLQNGAVCNRTDSSTRTALHWASMNGHSKVVDALLEHGADPKQTDNIYGFTPLTLSARQGHSDIVRKLALWKDTLDAYDIHGETALFEAVRNNKLECVDVLIKAGANIDAVDNANRTPLLNAVLSSRPQMVIKFIRAGCNQDIKGRITFFRKCDEFENIFSAFTAAIWGREYKLTKLMYEAGCFIYDVPHEWIKNWDDSREQEWLTYVMHRPRTLKERCRSYLRRVFGRNVDYAVDQLPIPTQIKNFLLLVNLEEFL